MVAHVPIETADLIKLLLVAAFSWIAKDLNGKLKTLIVKVDKLLEAQRQNDINFERNRVEIEQNAAGVADTRKSISTLWNNIRKHESFIRAIRALHNSIHTDKKINGGGDA